MDSIAITDMVIHGLLLITGVTGNMFILIVHFLDWLKTREHNPCHIIINSIGISNIFLQIANDVAQITYYLCPEAYQEQWVPNLTTAVTTSLTLLSLWCTTCLCFYYCVKIVNFTGPLFYKLKAKLPVVVPWLLVFSFVLSWSVGMPAYWDLYTAYSFSVVNNSGNVTLEEISYPSESKCNCIYYILVIVASLAFVVMFLASGAIIASLCKHMSRMKQNNEGLGHANIKTHLSAAITVTSLLILYLIFYGTFSYINNPTYTLKYLEAVISVIVISTFPTVNTVILIMGNSKLLNTLKQLLGVKSSVINTEIIVTTN